MSLTGDNVNNFIYKNYEQLHYIMNNINYLCDKEYPDLTQRQRNLFYKHLFTTMNTLTQSVTNENYEPVTFYKEKKKETKKKNSYFIDTILFFIICYLFHIIVNTDSLYLVKTNTISLVKTYILLVKTNTISLVKNYF